MTHEPTPIKVTPGSELAHLLDAAVGSLIVLEKDGVLYRVTAVAADDPFAGYDPDAAREGIRAAAGSWSDIDAEALKAHLYRAREEGTRPE